MRDREGMIARIRHIRRTAAPADDSAKAIDQRPDQIRALEARVAHLEQLLEGLQDSVHRESQRYHKAIAELDARIQPAAMGTALQDDARNRGL